MKKQYIVLLCLLAVCFAADTVRELKAYNADTRELISADTWQNTAKTIRFEWKEPLVEVKEYRYGFGVTGKEALTTSTTTNVCTI